MQVKIVPQREKIILFLESLDGLIYNMRETVAGTEVFRQRIREEWLEQKPLATYGYPPQVLSKPLEPALVRKILESLTKQVSQNLSDLQTIATNFCKKEGN